MTLHISEREVHCLLDMPTAIDAIEEVFRLQADGLARNVPRRRAIGEKATLHVMAAAIPSLDRLGFKAYTTGPSGAHFLINLYRESTGELDAVIEANRLGQLRTGAASGVSAKYLARDNAKVLTIIGSGYQARTQLEAIAHVRRLSTAYVYSRDSRNRTTFAGEMSEQIGINVEPVDDPKKACSKADIIVSATNSSTPVIKASWIFPGAHLIAMGANRIQAQELDVGVVDLIDLITVDEIEQCTIESGDLSQAVQNGALSWSAVVNLADVVAGRHPGRSHPDQTTLFKSLGIALWDVAVAHRLYEKAVQHGIGTKLTSFKS